MVMVSCPTQYPGHLGAVPGLRGHPWLCCALLCLQSQKRGFTSALPLQRSPGTRRAETSPFSAHSRKVMLNAVNPHRAPTWEKLPVVANRDPKTCQPAQPFSRTQLGKGRQVYHVSCCILKTDQLPPISHRPVLSSLSRRWPGSPFGLAAHFPGSP